MTAMKVVPVEPIDEMKIAAIKFHRGWLGDYFSFEYWAGVYESMLSAVEPAPDGLVERLTAIADELDHQELYLVQGDDADKLREVAAALTSRAAVLEEAAKICEATYPEKLGNELIELPCFDNAAECAAAIRAAKGE